MSFPFPLPAVPTSPDLPEWTGRGFRLGDSIEPVLTYAIDDSGWTDELTDFHEAQAGDLHYIDIASRRNALARLRKWAPADRPVIIDIGCSSGFMLRDIKAAFPQAHVLGADYVVGPLRKLARQHPDWPLLQFDLTMCPLPDASLDAAVLLNVFEHIGDDALAVRHLYRILRPGGVAVIEVPAGQELFDVYDRQLMHFRRYRLDGLTALLSNAGFEVHDASHIGFFLYPAFAFTKRRNQKYLSLPAEKQLEIVEKNINMARENPVMNWIMSLEGAVRYRIPFPCGIRCVAVARKP